MKFTNNIVSIIIVCLVLGLAPFYPEPHLWGKIKWIAGGAVGMTTMDWIDVLWHGWPFILLFRWIFLRIKRKSLA
ncbi:MAG: hypothetical protein KA954_02080 [Chitinophagales bacterium]|nr:hypothetical protein [Bacteroidota bacterium]MBP7398343.1 hypothetical protein [Chitinophagales bacterium]MBK8681236.1 hypothetical protein [Bacteroidota bacterium]MBP8753088.1 hypothetical protein [Chitinophagales bacterium]MBP9188114.1 hypothetical protein [Chitinophagales bacterium]